MNPTTLTGLTGEEIVQLAKKHTLFEWAARWNSFFTKPPLRITEAELREGFAVR